MLVTNHYILCLSDVFVGDFMPYKTNKELPDSVKDNLPQGAQTIYRKAFNSADEQYDEESRAHRVAWSAVKKEYKKKGDKWVRKD